MLIFVMMLVFGIFGIAALSVDMGIARLTQSQMQATADAAALEGARFGRQAARDLVAGATAGPNVSVTGGYGDLNLSANLVLETPSVYQPVLELNDANEVHGDMVAGTYTGGPPVEANDYTRNDLTPDPNGTAFLVRLRRTPDRQGLDNIPGVSSAGSPLPLLFGHGSLYMGPMRADGITVRATALADSFPAVGVNPLPGFPLLTSFALTEDFFRRFCDPDPVQANGFCPDSEPVTIENDGRITPPGNGALAVGHFVDPANTRAIGPQVATIPPPVHQIQEGYAPLYRKVGPASINRIMGYGYVKLYSLDGQLCSTGTPCFISANPERADRNLGTALPAVPPIPLDEWTEVVAANRALRSAARTVLVR